MKTMRHLHTPLFLVSFSIFFLLISQKANSQIINMNEMPRYYDRTARIKNPERWQSMRDVFHSDEFLLGRNIFSGNISYNMGRVILDEGDKKKYEIRSALSLFTRILIYEEISFNTTFFKNFNQQANAQWISDFTYSFGRYNWRPYKINFGYENYANNRYGDSFKKLQEKFLQGYLFASMGQDLSQKVMKYLRVDSTSGVRFTYFLRYAPKFKDQFENISGGMGKVSMGISGTYMIWRSFYVESALYIYPNPKAKQPWDPDYSYGFGYFDYRPFRLSLTYGNWVINQFPWNKTIYDRYGFWDGNFKLVFNYSW